MYPKAADYKMFGMRLFLLQQKNKDNKDEGFRMLGDNFIDKGERDAYIECPNLKKGIYYLFA